MSDNAIVKSPYRETGIVPDKKMFGLIRFPKTSPHECNKPSFFWHYITFRTIHSGSLWRCKCGLVFIAVGSDSPYWIFDANNAEFWKQSGGVLE